MAINFDRYLSRLRERRIDNPAYSIYRKTISTMSEPTKAINRQVNADLSRAGGSIGARAQTLLSSQLNQQNMVSQQFNEIDTQARQTNQEIDAKIAELEAAKQQQQDAQKDALLKTGIQVGGTALGAAVGSIVPGAGTMVGAQIGAAAGQIAGSFVGGGGKYGAEYIDEGQLIQGIGDLTAGITSTIALKDQRKLTRDLGDAILTNRENKPWLEGLQAAYLLGPDAVRQYISALSDPAKIEADAKLLNDGLIPKESTKSKLMTAPKITVQEKTATSSSPNAPINPGAGEQSFTVKKDGDYSVGTNGELVTKKNGAWVKVKDASGKNIKASTGDTIIIKADGTIEIRRNNG